MFSHPITAVMRLALTPIRLSRIPSLSFFAPSQQKMKFTMKLSAKRVKEEEPGDAAPGDPNKKAKT